MLWSLRLFAGFWLLPLCSACQVQTAQRRASDPNEIKIVSSLPRTGSANQQTSPMVQAMRLALEQAHYQAGPFHITFSDWDDASTKKGDWDPEVEAANATRAATDQDVMVYLGPYNSGAAKISMPILNRANLAMLSVATYSGLTKPGLGEVNEPGIYRPRGIINFFRINPADDIQGVLAARWIAQMHGHKVYVLDDQGLYGRGLADVFVDAADDYALDVMGRDSIDPRSQEYRSLMARIKTLEPDWIYFGGTTQTNAGQIAKDMVASGLRAKLMVPDAAMDQAFIAAASSSNADRRVYATFGGLPPQGMHENGLRFVQSYRKRFGTTPESFAIYAYVQMQVALSAIEKAGKKDRTAIREAIGQTHISQGILGSWSFTDTGDSTLRLMSGNLVQDGHFQFKAQLGD